MKRKSNHIEFALKTSQVKKRLAKHEEDRDITESHIHTAKVFPVQYSKTLNTPNQPKMSIMSYIRTLSLFQY